MATLASVWWKWATDQQSTVISMSKHSRQWGISCKTFMQLIQKGRVLCKLLIKISIAEMFLTTTKSSSFKVVVLASLLLWPSISWDELVQLITLLLVSLKCKIKCIHERSVCYCYKLRYAILQDLIGSKFATEAKFLVKEKLGSFWSLFKKQTLLVSNRNLVCKSS